MAAHREPALPLGQRLLEQMQDGPVRARLDRPARAGDARPPARVGLGQVAVEPALRLGQGFAATGPSQGRDRGRDLGHVAPRREGPPSKGQHGPVARVGPDPRVGRGERPVGVTGRERLLGGTDRRRDAGQAAGSGRGHDP